MSTRDMTWTGGFTLKQIANRLRYEEFIKIRHKR